MTRCVTSGKFLPSLSFPLPHPPGTGSPLLQAPQHPGEGTDLAGPWAAHDPDNPGPCEPRTRHPSNTEARREGRYTAQGDKVSVAAHATPSPTVLLKVGEAVWPQVS